MYATIRSRGVRFECDLASPCDCSIAVRPEALATDAASSDAHTPASVAAWNTPLPKQQPLQFDRYILDSALCTLRSFKLPLDCATL